MYISGYSCGYNEGSGYGSGISPALRNSWLVRVEPCAGDAAWQEQLERVLLEVSVYDGNRSPIC